MKKGILMEVNRGYIVVLTPEGEFLKGKRLEENYFIGEETAVFPLKEQKKPHMARWMSIAALAAVFLIAFTLLQPFSSAGKAYAYVSIDVNPSIELTINSDHKVITASAYNDEGREVLKRVGNLKKSTFKEAASKIIRQVKILGYFGDRKEIVIATVAVSGDNAGLHRELESEMNHLKPIAQKANANVEWMDASIRDRNKAKEEGQTAGKYLSEKQLDNQEQNSIVPPGKDPSKPVSREPGSVKPDEPSDNPKQASDRQPEKKPVYVYDKGSHEKKMSDEKRKKELEKAYEEAKKEAEKRAKKLEKEHEKAYKEWQKQLEKYKKEHEKAEKKHEKQKAEREDDEDEDDD